MTHEPRVNTKYKKMEWHTYPSDLHSKVDNNLFNNAQGVAS